MFFKDKSIMGLDIGTSSVKIAQIEETKNGLFLKSLCVGELPPEVVVEGEVMDVSVVTDKIKELLKEFSIKTKNVAVAVLGRSVIIKKIKLPMMKIEELEESIHMEAEQYIPFDIDDVNIDFQVIDGDTEDNENMDVMLVVVKKEKINDIMNMVIGSNLNPSIIDVDGFALENQYEINNDDEGQNVALIDIGASIANIIILKDGCSVFTRDISIGGNNYTKAIQKNYNLSFEQAEKIKLGEESDEFSRISIETALQEINEEVADEIQGTFGYFKATFEDENISKIVLSGGCACLAGFPEFLEQKLEIPVEISNPFKNIAFNEKDIDYDYLDRLKPMLAVVVGLALRKVGER